MRLRQSEMAERDHPREIEVKQRTIRSIGELVGLEESVVAAAAAAAEGLFTQLQGAKDLSFLARIKFDACGFDPLDVTRSLNLIEQLNQSFTYLATIEGTRWLLERHPSHAPYQLNLGTAPGFDIISSDRAVVAETFAATHPDSNRKLQKDVEKLRGADAKHKYVFYLSRSQAVKQYDDVTVVRLDHASLTNKQRADA